MHYEWCVTKLINEGISNFQGFEEQPKSFKKLWESTFMLWKFYIIKDDMEMSRFHSDKHYNAICPNRNGDRYMIPMPAGRMYFRYLSA